MSDLSPVPDAERYEIRVRGHLEARWVAWFDGMTLVRHSDGTTVLHGPAIDQAALHGLLRKLRDAGLPLISVTPQETRPAAAPDSRSLPHSQRRPS